MTGNANRLQIFTHPSSFYTRHRSCVFNWSDVSAPLLSPTIKLTLVFSLKFIIVATRSTTLMLQFCPSSTVMYSRPHTAFKDLTSTMVHSAF